MRYHYIYNIGYIYEKKMPIFGANNTISNIKLQQPITLTIQIPYNNIENAMAQIGNTVDYQTIAGARWGLYVYVCPQNLQFCQTPVYAFSVVFRVQQSGFYLEFDPGNYYISNPPILSFQYPVQNLTSDAIISVTIDGSNITVTGNGQQILTVDMLKSFSTITQLSSGCWFYDNNNDQIQNYDSDYLSFLVNISTPFNLSSLLSSIIPIIAIVPLLSLLPQILKDFVPTVKQKLSKKSSNTT